MSDDLDINSLNLKEPEPEDWDDYAVASAAPTAIVVPDKGLYMLVQTTEPEIKATAAGDLLIKFDASICGGEFDGYNVRFISASAKVFERKGKKVSFISDYFLSHGVPSPRTTAERIQMAKALTGHPFFAQCDWEGSCAKSKGGCGEVVKGQDKFPKGEDGARLSRIPCPKKCKVTLDDGREVVKNIFANLKVTAFVPPPQA